MKQSCTYFDRSARRALAIVFACLFIFQAVGFFHAAAAMAAPSVPGSVAETIHGAVAGENCDRLAHQGAPDHSPCDEAGFCPFCLVSDRDAALFSAPPTSSLIGVLTPGDEPARRFARSIDRSTPLPMSSGLDASRFATAPPRI